MSAPPFMLSTFALCVLLTTSCNRSTPVSVPQKLHIEITGGDFEWHVRYAGLDEVFGTADDFFARRNVALISNTPTTIDLKSDDYIYSFALPHLNLREIAVPDLVFSLEFSPKELGEFKLKGDQLCGYQHPKLIGKVRVLSPRDFARWFGNAASRNRDQHGDSKTRDE